ncbi:MAG: phosphoadenosine phosphosulfate reductase family protein [Methanomassiliicoccales archaeon]|nr:phosphoadenosine phosphosulfate reductase family protein [Methanomassiliicoccales archaeon]NYT14881.1 phosphoadenosine phosphosulfate reductase family protein [Methanomassiliicoccales archaeon]
MGAVRLGKILLRWCDHCDLPLLEEDVCGICGSEPKKVEMTPPGDPRPAFPGDIEVIRKVIDDQFGEGCGLVAIPDGRIVLLNKVPALDRMDEVIVGGEVIGALRYDLDSSWRFIMRMNSARTLQGKAVKGCVIADIGAVKPIVSGANLLAPGVIDVHEGVVPGDEVLILDPDGRAIGTGNARMSSGEMLESQRGVAIKTRWTAEPSDYIETGRTKSWDDVVRANQRIIDRRVEEAVKFVRKTMDRNPLPAVVSFSGGKDSLACALVIEDAGLKLPLLFIDTTLEFPETVSYVEEYASEKGLELKRGSASKSIFMESVERFGPPGRDFRWCCKTNKLGPTVRTILEEFPEGVLSFIGQRRYESQSRSEKPRIWKNPWVPGQVGAAPIQNWTSMHVWIYIFSKDAKYNPWYEKGLDRIGCYVCPSADLGEQCFVEEHSPEFRQYKEDLEGFAEKRGLPLEWSSYALWRWRRVPGSIKQELSRIGVEPLRCHNVTREVIELRLDEAIGDDISLQAEGKFNLPLDSATMSNFLTLMGEVTRDGNRFTVDGTIIEDNLVIIKGRDKRDIRTKSEKLVKIVRKADGCVGCGVCLGKCKKGALHLEGGRLRIVEERCVHCGECIEPCPALSFIDVDFEF